MQPITFDSPVKNGVFLPAIRDQIRTVMSGMEGKRVRVSLKEIKRGKTNRQLGYYFSTIVPYIAYAMQEAGNVMDSDEVHNFLKEHVAKLTKVITDPQGVRHKIVRSLSETDKDEMSDFITVVLVWAAEMSIVVPPSEDYSLNSPEASASGLSQEEA